MTVSILNDYFDTLHTPRSWLIALCLTANLVSRDSHHGPACARFDGSYGLDLRSPRR
jgi:hypothetical protein